MEPEQMCKIIFIFACANDNIDLLNNFIVNSMEQRIKNIQENIVKIHKCIVIRVCIMSDNVL